MLGCRERCTCPWPVGAQAWVGELASPPGAVHPSYLLPPTHTTTAPSHSPLLPSSPLLPTTQGYGTLLMLEAERIARCEHRSAKLAVISGVGTRHYYRKLG